jgi:hypothetical protein
MVREFSERFLSASRNPRERRWKCSTMRNRRVSCAVAEDADAAGGAHDDTGFQDERLITIRRRRQ